MYGALATYYDRLMSDVPYAAWADFAERFLPKGEGIDLACGTGAFTLELMRRGRRMAGIDSSADMLRVACEKSLSLGADVTFAQGDMTRFTREKTVDFVTCVCDGINYVRRPLAVFERVRDLLRPNGVFLFDISSDYKLRHTIGDRTFFYDDGNLVYVWRNFPKKDYIDMDLTFFRREGGNYVRSDESQRQFIHTAEDLCQSLSAVGFETRVFGGYADRAATATDERLCFVCGRHS